MTDITLINLLIYSSQLLLVVAAAAIGGGVFPVSSARTRLTYWRAAVVACLILPFLPARSAHIAVGAARGTQVATAVGASIAATHASAPALSAIAAALPWLLLLGAATRAAWLALGLVRLRRLRARSTPDVPGVIDEEVDALRRAVAPRAELRWHDDIAQPLTFGLRRPIVLLPRSVGDLPPDARRAVICHELLHVARHDWAWMVGEEIVRTVFWFHPAMWWALGQVQLSREQTVDEMVVALTAARVPYMRALMMFADARPGLASAIPFVRPRHLASRLRQLSQENTMSSLRLGFTGVVLAGVLIGSSLAVASAVPLRARAIAAQDAAHLKQFPKVIKEVKPEYPVGMIDYGISGDVTLTVTISPAGDVIDAEASSWGMRTTKNDTARTTAAATAAAQPFVDAAKAAAQQWKFTPADSESTVEILFTFTTKSNAEIVGGVSGGVGGGVVGGVRGGVASGVVGGQVGGVGGGVVGGVVGGVLGGVAGSARPGELPPQPAAARLRVGGAVKPPRKLMHVSPMYPEDAKVARVQGVVVIEVTIAKDGSVSDARILRSVPMLDQAALEAVRQWRFMPTLLNGEPVEVVMTVAVNFGAQ